MIHEPNCRPNCGPKNTWHHLDGCRHGPTYFTTHQDHATCFQVHNQVHFQVHVSFLLILWFMQVFHIDCDVFSYFSLQILHSILTGYDFTFSFCSGFFRVLFRLSKLMCVSYANPMTSNHFVYFFVNLEPMLLDFIRGV